MSTEADRQFVEAMAERAAQGDKNKMQPMMAIVTEHGTGDFDGMVRVRRTPHEEPGAPARPFYYVFGDLPAVDAEVFAMSNFATGVVMGAIPDDYRTVSEAGVAVPSRPQLNFGAGFDVADNAGASRTDVTLDLGEISVVSYKTIQEEGTARTQRDNLNFGSGFDVADNVGATSTDVTFDPTEVATPIRDALLTVDGAGSGLDADLLDGVQGSGYVPAAHVGSGGGAHANANTSTAGFLSGTDKTKLDTLSTQALGAFHAYPNSADLMTSATYTKMIADVESFDPAGWYDTAQTRYEPGRNGLYVFGASVQFPAMPIDRQVWIRLYKNGSPARMMGSNGTTHLAGTFDLLTEGMAICDAVVGDFFEVFIWQDAPTRAYTGNTTNAWDFTQFWGYYLGTL